MQLTQIITLKHKHNILLHSSKLYPLSSWLMQVWCWRLMFCVSNVGKCKCPGNSENPHIICICPTIYMLALYWQPKPAGQWGEGILRLGNKRIFLNFWKVIAAGSGCVADSWTAVTSFHCTRSRNCHSLSLSCPIPWLPRELVPYLHFCFNTM